MTEIELMRLQDEVERLRSQVERLKASERQARETAISAMALARAPNEQLRVMLAEIVADLECLRGIVGAG